MGAQLRTLAESFRRLGRLLESGHVARCPACTGLADAGYYTGEAHEDLLATYGVELDRAEMRGACEWSCGGTCPVCGADAELDGQRRNGEWSWSAVANHRAPVRVGAEGHVLDAWATYQRARATYLASPAATELAAYQRAFASWRQVAA